MAWNEPGGQKPRDPWGGGGGDQGGPPDLDEALRKLQQRLNELFGGQPGHSGGSGLSGLLPIAVAGLLGIMVWSGLYQINEQERAVVLRLGTYHRTLGPGLHWTWPMLESTTKLNATSYRQHTTEGQMLTQDENIINVKLSVQYNVSDAKSYVLAVRDPENSLREATDSALRHVVGSSKMHQVLTEGREQIAVEVQNRLQQYLDTYVTGIQVTKVNVENTDPPSEVQSAFDDVTRAREDEERLQNEAKTYANGIVPEARGRKQRIMEDASAYRDQVVARAEGEAQRFEKLLTEYRKAPEVTRQRLYTDAIQQVMSNSSKILVDVKGGNNVLYLPLDKSSQPAVKPTTPTAEVPSVRELTNQVIDQLRQDAQTTSRRRELR